MSELYEMIGERDLLTQAKVYAIIKRINENDLKKNRTRNISNTINRRCEELGMEDTQQEIFNKVSGLRLPFWRERNELEKKMEQDIVKNTILSELEKVNCLHEIKADTLIWWSQLLALMLVSHELKTSQIRKFLSGVRRNEVNIKRNLPEEFSREEVAFLKVHLAYAKSRQKSVKHLMEVMTSAIDKIGENGKEGMEDFLKFVRFVEAVVAYHRFYGGTE